MTNHTILSKHALSKEYGFDYIPGGQCGIKNIVSSKWVSNTIIFNVPPRDCFKAKVTTRPVVDGYKPSSPTSV